MAADADAVAGSVVGVCAGVVAGRYQLLRRQTVSRHPFAQMCYG